MKKAFKKIAFFTATSDVWSRQNVSFIAVTVHYFEPNNLDKIQSAFIACEHFLGSHTHDRVAAKLKEILKRYGILDRVYFMTTDGAGEYTAAFKNFGPNYSNMPVFAENSVDLLSDGEDGPNSSRGDVPQPVEIDSDDDSDDDEINLFERIPTRENHSENVNNDDDDSFVVENLPVHMLVNMNRIDCSAHKLDKIGKKDADKALGLDDEYGATMMIYTIAHSQNWKRFGHSKKAGLRLKCFIAKQGRESFHLTAFVG